MAEGTRKLRKAVELVMGPSGAGKTHLVSQHKGKPFTTVISVDDIKKELYGNEWLWFADHNSFRELLHRLRKALLNTAEYCDQIYIDHPFLTRAAREQVYKICKEVMKSAGIPIDIFLTKLNTPLDVCLERNKKRDIPVTEKVIRRQFKHMQYPHELENDKVICKGSHDYRHYTDVQFPDDYVPIHKREGFKKLEGGGKHVVLPNRHDHAQSGIHNSSSSSHHDSSLRTDSLDPDIHHPETFDEMVERIMRARARLWSERRRSVFSRIAK